jgi:hypothetical protein
VAQGPSEVFRIVEINSTKLCHGIDSCFTVANFPLAYAWVVTVPVGSNTETDDDCRPATFHRGAFGVKAPFSTQQYHGVVKK